MDNIRIPLMNVSRQYAGLKEEIDNAICSVLESGNYINGENVKAFEQEFADYIGVDYAIGVGNGTDALVIALKAIGVKEGDEVITCALTFYATAEAIANVGATPVFVDCTADTYVMDVDAIEKKITNKTKAIIPVQLYGQCAKMEKVCALAKKYNLFVVEDVAQAAGSVYRGKKAGAWGDVACVSFFPTKNLGAAGDGGIILTNSEDLAKKCRAYRVHGSGLDGLYTYKSSRPELDLGDVDFGNNQPKYFNYIVGYNSRLDEVQAALLRVKLPHLDAWNNKRREIAKRYENRINNPLVKHPTVTEGGKHIYYVYVVTMENSVAFHEYLNSCGIATGVYFPVPLHLQRVFAELGYKKGDFPNAEYVAEHSAAIPMFPELSDEEVNEIIRVVNMYK